MPEEPTIARLQQGPVELPFEYAYNQVLAKAKINGDKDAIFIIDTGASQSMMDQTYAETIGATEKSDYFRHHWWWLDAYGLHDPEKASVGRSGAR